MPVLLLFASATAALSTGSHLFLAAVIWGRGCSTLCGSCWPQLHVCIHVDTMMCAKIIKMASIVHVHVVVLFLLAIAATSFG